jgi:hypothetical protein
MENAVICSLLPDGGDSLLVRCRRDLLRQTYELVELNSH